MPVPIQGLSGVTAVGVSDSTGEGAYSCALLDDGSAKCWGSNLTGRLGNGGSGDSDKPVDVLLP
jgi:hypothetical protein